jgi:uncharacterized protein (DUF1330 family)
MPAYVLIDVDVTDPERYAEYRRLGGAATALHGGRFLARAGAVATLEGAWRPTRMVVIEFREAQAAHRWYDSPEYAQARQARAGAAVFRCIVVEGLADKPASNASS